MATVRYERPQIFDRRTGLIALLSVLVFSALLAGLALAPLQEGVLASGTISVQSERKQIQHLEGGIVAEILVSEGEAVSPGQPLIRLDTTQMLSERAQISAQLATAYSALDRVYAEQQGLNDLAFSQPDIDVDLDVLARAQQTQLQRFNARAAQREGQIWLLQQKIEQHQNRLSGLGAQQTALTDQHTVLADDLARFQTLYESRAVDLSVLSQRQRDVARILGDIGQVAANIAQTQVQISEAELSILQLNLDFQSEITGEQAQREGQINSLLESLNAVNDVISRTQLVAPVSGQILNLQVATIGGIIPPGQPIMEIVPSNDALIINTEVNISDIDSIYLGQQVRVTLTALNSRLTPELAGTITHIAPDAVTDPRTGVPTFPVRIAFSPGEIDPEIARQLRPGMNTQIFILGGSQTPLEYLMRPFTDTFQRALKEG